MDWGLQAPFYVLFLLFFDGRQIARLRSLPAGCDQALKTARRTLGHYCHYPRVVTATFRFSDLLNRV
eukprot:scaffold2752_cov69-Skeletonema_marinoi.AAC.1